MGSIEAFPARKGATIADVWRAAPVGASGVVRVRATRLEDFAAIRALQRRSAPYLAPCSLKQLEGRIHAFPAGQMVAVADAQVVGAASALAVKWDDYGLDHTWRSITGDGSFATHDETGRTLYGVDAIVDASRRGFGIARALQQAQRRLCRGRNLRRIIATTRLAGYAATHGAVSAELYAMRVIWGDLPDPAMRFMLSLGYQYCGILHGYLPEDAESGGCAALLAWLNPLYSPPEPPAYMAPERQQRRVA